jgi:hypothetical protein
MKKAGKSGTMDSVRFPTHLNLPRYDASFKPGDAQIPSKAEDPGEHYHKAPISSEIENIYSADLFPGKHAESIKDKLLSSTALRRFATVGLAALSLFGAIAAQPLYAAVPQHAEVTHEHVVENGQSRMATDAKKQPAPKEDAPKAADAKPETPQEKSYDSEAGQAIARSARSVAKKMNREGKCFRGVKRALGKTGIQLQGRYAYQAASQLAKNITMKEIKVDSDSLGELKPGSIVVWSKCKGHPFGHASVALGDGNEASDHIQEQITYLGKGATFRVFIPVQ